MYIYKKVRVQYLSTQWLNIAHNLASVSLRPIRLQDRHSKATGPEQGEAEQGEKEQRKKVIHVYYRVSTGNCGKVTYYISGSITHKCLKYLYLDYHSWTYITTHFFNIVLVHLI